jgi:prevent-host-death family protein
METISVAEAKAHLSDLLVRIEQGEEIIITRRGKPIARLSPLRPAKKPVPSLTEFRAQVPRPEVSATEVLQMLRKESR